MTDDLEERVNKFHLLELPGQPMAMHMGTSYLVSDLWREVKKLRVILKKEDDMNGIGWAVKELRDGRRVQRVGWNGKDMYLELQTPDSHSKMTLPYVYMKTVQGDLVPWLCSQTDMLATDWQLYSGPNT